jgi:citrate lyase subunit beta/citryl-CoA lyase
MTCSHEIEAMNLPRSYLFVPGDRPERFAKALASGADAVVLDLEDAVAPAAKAAAREAIAEFLQDQEAERARLVLRVNAEDTAWFAADCELLAFYPGLSVLLPKAHDVLVLQALQGLQPGLPVLPLVETAAGMLAAAQLAAAPGVQRLVFGTLDYALDMALEGQLATTVGLDAPASHLALVSRAAGIASPVAGVTPAIDDEALLQAEWARARAHGFGAKLCIHPRQVAAVHAALLPTAAELSWAQRVLQAADGAAGAVQLDGRMVDKPVIERACRIVARAGR